MRITKGGRSIEVSAEEVEALNAEIEAIDSGKPAAAVTFNGVLPVVGITKPADPVTTAAVQAVLNTFVATKETDVGRLIKEAVAAEMATLRAEAEKP